MKWAQLLMADRLRPGDVVIDATLGNGHDALFLAQQVSPGGHVFGFDVQAAAVQETTRRLQEAGLTEADFTLFLAGHETLLERVPEATQGQVRGIMFNLGYLPGSDKSVITHTETTLVALKSALEILARGGLLTIAIYPGHEGGADEQRKISEWATQLLPRQFEVQQLRPVNRAAAPPECWAIWKNPTA